MATNEEEKERLTIEIVKLYLHWEKLCRISIVLGVLLILTLIWELIDLSVFSVTCWLLTFAINVYMYFDLNRAHMELDTATEELIKILEKEIDEKIS